MRPDGTLDEMQVKMVILTCMTSSVASRLEVAVIMDCRARDADEQAAPVRRDFLNDQTTRTEAVLRFERLFAPPDAVAHACEAVEAIKHKPWNNDLIRSTVNKIDKAQDRARGEHGTDRSRRKMLLDVVETCSKLHPLVAKAVGSERSLLVEANNEFEQNRTPNEYVNVLERWENRLIKAARGAGVDCYCILQGL